MKTLDIIFLIFLSVFFIMYVVTTIVFWPSKSGKPVEPIIDYRHVPRCPPGQFCVAPWSKPANGKED